MRKRKTGEDIHRVTKFFKAADDQACAEYKRRNQANKQKKSTICLTREVYCRTLRKSNRLNKVTDPSTPNSELIKKQSHPTRSSKRLREKRNPSISRSPSSAEGLCKTKKQKVTRRSLKYRNSETSPATVHTFEKNLDAQDWGQEEKMYNSYSHYNWSPEYWDYSNRRYGYQEYYRGRMDYREYDMSYDFSARTGYHHPAHSPYGYHDHGNLSRRHYDRSGYMYDRDSSVPERAVYDDYGSRRFAEDIPADGHWYEEHWSRYRNVSPLPSPDRYIGELDVQERFNPWPEARLRGSASWSGRTHLEESRYERSDVMYRFQNTSVARTGSPSSGVNFRLRDQEHTQGASGITSDGQKSASKKASVKTGSTDTVYDTVKDTGADVSRPRRSETLGSNKAKARKPSPVSSKSPLDSTAEKGSSGKRVENNNSVDRSGVQKKSNSDEIDGNGVKHHEETLTARQAVSAVPLPVVHQPEPDCGTYNLCGGGDFTGKALPSCGAESKEQPESGHTGNRTVSMRSSEDKTSTSSSDCKGLMKTNEDIDRKVLRDVDFVGRTCGSGGFAERGNTELRTQDGDKMAASLVPSADGKIITNTKVCSSFQESRGRPYHKPPLHNTLTSEEVYQQGVSVQVGNGSQQSISNPQNDSAKTLENAFSRLVSWETISIFSNSGKAWSEFKSQKCAAKILEDRISESPSSEHAKEYLTVTSKTVEKKKPEATSTGMKLQDSEQFEPKDIDLKQTKQKDTRFEELHNRHSDGKHTESADPGMFPLNTSANILNKKEGKDSEKKHQELARHMSSHHDSRRQLSKIKDSDRHMSKYVESERHGYKGKESERHGFRHQAYPKHQESEKRGSKESKKHGSGQEESDMSRSKHQEVDRHESKHKGADRHGSKSQESERRGSGQDESNRHGSKHKGSDRHGSKSRESERRGSGQDESNRHGSKHKGPDRHGSKSGESERRGSGQDESNRHESKHKGSDRHGSKSGEFERRGSRQDESDRHGSKHKRSDRHESRSKVLGKHVSKGNVFERQGSKSQGSDKHGSGQDKSDGRGSTHRESDGHWSKNRKSAGPGSKHQKSDDDGPKGRDSDGHGSKTRESDGLGSKNRGSDGHGPKTRESDELGSENRESDGLGSENKESDGHESKNRESDGLGCKNRESEGHGSKSRESDGTGSKPRESDVHGSTTRESDVHGSKTRESDVHGSKTRESDVHGSETREPDGHGSRTRESDGLGSENRESDGLGSNTRESDGHGSKTRESDGHSCMSNHQESFRFGSEHQESDTHGSNNQEPERQLCEQEESDKTGFQRQVSEKHKSGQEKSARHESKYPESDHDRQGPMNRKSDVSDQPSTNLQDLHDSGRVKPEACSDAKSESSSKAISGVHVVTPSLSPYRKRHHSGQSIATSNAGETSQTRMRHFSDQHQRRTDSRSSTPLKLSLSSPRHQDRQRPRADGNKEVPATSSKPGTPKAKSPLTSPERPNLVYRIKHKSGSSSSCMEHVSPLSNLEFSYRERCERPSRQPREQEKPAEDETKKPVFEEHLEDPLDDNCDSDDSFLDTVPDFLRDVEAASSMPTSSTSGSFGKGLSENLDVLSDSEDFVVNARPSARTHNYKFSLDTLLTEKIEKEEKNRELDAMREELTEGIKQGGFVRLASEVEPARDTDLLPEHQNQLESLSVSKQKILEVHPGVNVFTASRFKCLFSESLPLTACSFTPGSSQIDRYLANIQPEWIVHLLTSRILAISFEKVSCPDAVLTWLFYIISVHRSRLVVDCCRKDVEEILVRQQEFDTLKVTWCPSLKVILRVLLNYGATLNSLCQDRSLLQLTDEEMRELDTALEEPLCGDVPPDAQPEGNGRLNRENFRQVIQVIALGLQGRPMYSTSQLIALTVVLSNSALDSTLVNDMLKQDFQICLACLIEKFPKDEWPVQAISLCETLSTITTHHHNKVCLVELFPLTPRGQYIRRRLSYIILCDLLSLNRQGQDLTDLKVEYLAVMVPRMRALVATDLYLLSSVITLMDRCVGNEVLRLSEKKDLRILMELVRTLTGDVRDSVTMLDRTKVKDMMVRLTSTWTFMMQSMGSKQPSLFAWRKNDSPLKVETLSSHVSDSGSEASDEEEEDEEDIIFDKVEVVDVVTIGAGEHSETAESLCADNMAAVPEDMDVSVSEDCVQAEDRRSLQRLLETDEDVIPEI